MIVQPLIIINCIHKKKSESIKAQNAVWDSEKIKSYFIPEKFISILSAQFPSFDVFTCL